MIFIDFGLVFNFSLGWSARSPTPTPPTIPGPLGLLFYDEKKLCQTSLAVAGSSWSILELQDVEES